MERTVYLNGDWLNAADAHISVEDRGFLFADGVYEVVRYYGGRGFAMSEHVERLRHSLAEIRIGPPPELDRIDALSDEVLSRNGITDGIAYWQVTRGAAPRNHIFPPDGTRPTVLLMAYPGNPLDRGGPVIRLRAITRPDVRWQHCHIKSIALLPNVLDAQAAAESGCQEAILHRDGVVTEGTHRSVAIVDTHGLHTYPLDGRILDSITRRTVLESARQAGITVIEKPYPLEKLYQAEEVIALGSTTEVASITHIDGQPIADGRAGPVAEQLLELYRKHVIETCGL